MVCLPKEEGCLEVLNITVQNESPLPKHLHEFYKRAQIPWVMAFYFISPIENDLDRQNANEDGLHVYENDKDGPVVKYYYFLR